MGRHLTPKEVLVISATAKIPTYRVNPVFLLPLLWLVFWLRRALVITPLTFALYASAILFHDLGHFIEGFVRF